MLGLHNKAKGLDIQTWTKLVISSGDASAFLDGIILPGLPAPEIQSAYVGSSGSPVLASAAIFYAHLVKQVHAPTHVLDFGCGWGRITRFFLKDLPPECIVGVDVLPQAIALCEQHLPGIEFKHIGRRPPLPFGDETFDLAFAYSVFSHLPQAIASAWVDELARVISPRGALVVTTQGKHFIDFCAKLADGRQRADHEWHKRLIGSVGKDIPSLRTSYDQGEFCYFPSGGAGDSGELYGEAFVPEKFMKQAWSKRFVVESFIDDLSQFPQAVAVLRRRQ